MDYLFLGNTAMQWLIAAGVTGATAFALYLVKSLLVRRLGALAERTKTRYDDIVVAMLASTSLLVILVIAAYAGSSFLTLTARAELIIARIAIATGLIQAALWGDVAVRTWLHQYRADPHTDASHATSTAAMGFIVRMIVWTVFLLMILDNMGVNITTLVASLGIGGIAVALAVQNVLGDLFASLSIVLDKPFVIGDYITVDDMGGTVEFVGLKTTRLRSLGGEQLIFSNADLLGSRIHNLKRMETRRVVFTLGVTYDTPEQQLREIPQVVGDIVRTQQQVTFNRAHLSNFGPSSLDFEVVYTVNSADYTVHMDARQQIYLDIFKAFNERGIEFAFPTQTLHIASAPLVEQAAGDGRTGLRSVNSPGTAGSRGR